MHRPVRALLIATLLFCAAPAAGEEIGALFSPEIREADMRRRLTVLASDAMRGRETISPEAVAASDYIAAQWKAMGLLPKGDDGTWFQSYIVDQPILKDGNALTVRDAEGSHAYAVEKDWNPFSVTSSGSAEGDVVFAGYGIRAAGEPYDYDDYADVDVKGKVVLVFRKNPGWREVHHASFRTKLAQAAKAGAAALLLCNNPATSGAAKRDAIGHWSAGLGVPAGSGPIPYAFVSQDVARRLLAPTGRTLEEIETALRADGPQSAALEGVQVAITTALATVTEANARNVVGFLPGRDPACADEVVVLGAHYDHVGLGLFGSTGGAAAAGKIHNGADDNGSGTTALLELAEWFADGANRPRRSLLFLAFSGEERGLLGSAHYVSHPLVPLEDVVLMLNMDMVGRSRDGRLQVGGVGTARGLQDLVAEANREHGLKIEWDQQGVAPSDSTSFFRKGLPVLFFFTGLHADYHKPSDDVEKINFADMTRICRLCRDVGTAIAEREERLEFTRPPAPKRPPTLGVRPSPEPDPRGIVIAAVIPGGPCAQAGMESADVLISIAGEPVRDLQTLRSVLLRLEAGKTVAVVVIRDEKEVTLKVTLGRRGGRRGKRGK
jgi:aminopeptidase YwaD